LSFLAGRRNLTDKERAYNIGKLYELNKKRHGGQIPKGSAHFEHSLLPEEGRGNSCPSLDPVKQSGQNVPLKTCEAVSVG
jgi:hypothetical protein